MVSEHWRRESTMSSGHGEERIDGEEEYEYLCHEREMMVDEAALLTCVHRRPCSFVYQASIERGLEDVLAGEEEDYKKLL